MKMYEKQKIDVFCFYLYLQGFLRYRDVLYLILILETFHFDQLKCN